jgi:hypothetical protein
VISGIVHVIRNGLRRRDAPAERFPIRWNHPIRTRLDSKSSSMF